MQECEGCKVIRKEVSDVWDELSNLRAKYAAITGFLRGIAYILGGVTATILLIKDIFATNHQA